MRIAPQSLDRIRQSRLTGEGLAKIVQSIGESMIMSGTPVGQITLDYQMPEDDVAPGDLIPVLSITLRAATVKE